MEVYVIIPIFFITVFIMRLPRFARNDVVVVARNDVVAVARNDVVVVARNDVCVRT